MALRILLNGAHGRMGRAVAAAAPACGATIAAAVGSDGDLAGALADCGRPS